MFGIPKAKSASGASHHRSQSSPYFQHTRAFTESRDTDSDLPHINNAPVACHVAALSPTKSEAVKRQGHARSLTCTSPAHQPPLITTDIRVESSPAPASTLPSSLFSGPTGISFDLSPPTSPSLSPTKEKERWSFIPNFRPERQSGARSERSPSPLRIADWFQGESAPVSISVVPSPTKEGPDPLELVPIDSSRPASPQRKPTADPTNMLSRAPAPSKPAAGSAGIFSFFASKLPTAATTTTAPPVTASSSTNDEFLNLDIKKALQPSGPSDPFSPSSFKNLQQNAEGLLARMQAAYRQRVIAVNDAKAEQEAQQEECEEAQTRAQHLKHQLDNLSSRLDEREREMQKLVEQLEEEKRLRREEAERARTIRLVDDGAVDVSGGRSRTSLGSTVSTPSMMSDAGSDPSDFSDPFRSENSSSVSSPYTPRSHPWPNEASVYQYQIPAMHGKKLDPVHGGSHELARENVELKARVGHLERELDGCLDLLKGIALA